MESGGSPESLNFSQCFWCRKFRGKGNCDEFPGENSIPPEITFNRHDHRVPFYPWAEAGSTGFEPVDGYTPPPFGQLKKIL